MPHYLKNILQKKNPVFFLLFLVCAVIPAEENNTAFWGGISRVASFGKPFWADMSAPLVRIEFAYAENSRDYDFGEHDAHYRPYVFPNLGGDIPLWSGDFADEKYGFRLTLSFKIDIWFDWFEKETHPVIHTGYGFGLFEAGFIHRFDSPLVVFPHFNIYNWGVKLSLFKHESTHLSDELIVRRIVRWDSPITRIDVAYNYAELIFTVNDPDSRPRTNHGFKFGLLFNYQFKKGWYDIPVPEEVPDAAIVGLSRFPLEIYMQYQYQSPFFSHGFQIIASAEYRLKEQLNYPFPYSSGVKPDGLNLVNCFNILAGLRHDYQRSKYFSKIGIGLRYYYGLNPYGEFRAMPSYSQFGIVALFE